MHAIRIPILAVVLTLSAPALAFGWGVQGNGKITTEARNLQGFKRVDLRGSVDADIEEGDGFSVSLTIDSNLQQLVTTEVQGEALVVSTRDNLRPSRQSRLRITLPELRGVDIEGSGDARITGVRQSRDLAVRVSGSGDVHYTGPVHALELKMNGSGDVRAELSGTTETVSIENQGSGDIQLRGGTVNSLQANLSSSGDLEAKGLPAKSASLSLSGSGDASVTLGGGELRARLSGSGDLNWWGEAARKDIDQSGSGDIRHHS